MKLPHTILKGDSKPCPRRLYNYEEVIKGQLKEPVHGSVEAALIEMYLAGVSVRRVEDITEALWGRARRQGNCYIIMELLVTGFSVAGFPMQDVVGNGIIYLCTALRLLIIPGILLGLMCLFHASAMLTMYMVICFACPCGLNPVIYAAAYGQDCTDGTSMALLTNLLSVVTIPLMYALVVAAFGPI